jgi:hypothetical protein
MQADDHTVFGTVNRKQKTTRKNAYKPYTGFR